MSEYGYCRISKKTMNIERQVRNIRADFPNALIIKETFTGTRVCGRKELDKLLRILKSGDTVIFDSACRMSRNEEDAVALYEKLFTENVNLVFIKEPQINSAVYRQALENQLEVNLSTGNNATDQFVQDLIAALNRYTIEIIKGQIRNVFSQAQKEVENLHLRTTEGILTAKLNGKQIGQKKGAKLTTKKSIEAKKLIQKYSKDFNGFLADKEVQKIVGICRNSFYKYKREMKEREVNL